MFYRPTPAKFAMSLLAVVCFLSLPSAAQSQDDVQGTVSGLGTVSLKQQPTLLRMTIDLSGKAATTKEALSNLKDRRDAAEKLLETLAADKKSISISDARLSAADNNQQRQMQAVYFSPNSRGGRVPEGLKIPKSVSVFCTLTAEWELKYKDPEELLLIATDLQDKIVAADLAGIKEPKKLTPEEQELAEEIAAMNSNHGHYGDSEAQPGEPQFVYVARISDEERAKAMAEAFAKAKIQATELAQAAGSKLGSLTQVKQQPGGAGDDVDEYYAYAMRRRMMANMGVNDENEALSQVPGQVTFGFAVEASFLLDSK